MIKQYIGRTEIDNIVSDMANRICLDQCKGKNQEHLDPLTLIPVLDGAMPFCSDLMRAIWWQRPMLEVRILPAKARSYRDGTLSGQIAWDLIPLREEILGSDALIVEDILDSGQTCQSLVKHLKERGAERIRIAALLNKQAHRRHDVQADYVGQHIDDHFVVGYGMDHAGKHRNLPWIGIEESK